MAVLRRGGHVVGTMNLLSRLGTRGAALIAATAALGCTSASPECATFCKQASECGLLPSALGTDSSGANPSNCESRCANTGEELQRAIIACEYPGSSEWCDGGVCPSMAQCLFELAPDGGLLGSSTLYLYAYSPGRSASGPTCPAASLAGDDRVQRIRTSAAAAGGCGQFDTAQFAIEENGQLRFGPVISCAEQIQAGARFDGVGAGLVKATVILRRDDKCAASTTANTLLPADSTGSISVPLPGAEASPFCTPAMR